MFLNGGGGRELVPARSDAVLAGDDDRVSSQVFRPRNDISGFYPHRVMPHNAAASITRRAVASLSLSLVLVFSDFPREPRVPSFPGGQTVACLVAV